jgi:PTH1 family peptidyl-tRNA hydrolase
MIRPVQKIPPAGSGWPERTDHPHKPATFMNEKRPHAGEAMVLYKLGLDALTVFHDEPDLGTDEGREAGGGNVATMPSFDRMSWQFIFAACGSGSAIRGWPDRVHGYVLQLCCRAG